MRVKYNGVNYEIKIRGTYNFYGEKVKVMNVVVDEKYGFIVYEHEQSGCKLYNVCQIEEFAEQNPEIVKSVER